MPRHNSASGHAIPHQIGPRFHSTSQRPRHTSCHFSASSQHNAQHISASQATPRLQSTSLRYRPFLDFNSAKCSTSQVKTRLQHNPAQHPSEHFSTSIQFVPLHSTSRLHSNTYLGFSPQQIRAAHLSPRLQTTTCQTIPIQTSASVHATPRLASTSSHLSPVQNNSYQISASRRFNACRASASEQLNTPHSITNLDFSSLHTVPNRSSASAQFKSVQNSPLLGFTPSHRTPSHNHTSASPQPSTRRTIPHLGVTASHGTTNHGTPRLQPDSKHSRSTHTSASAQVIPRHVTPRLQHNSNHSKPQLGFRSRF